MTSLVVDDSRAMRRIVRSILTHAVPEEQVLEAGDGRAALDVLEEHLAGGGDVPSLACIDWNMPVMDGLELVGCLRRRRELRGMTLMMVTTEAEQGQIVRALAAGAHEYLIKPFTAEDMVVKLDLLGLLPVGAGA